MREDDLVPDDAPRGAPLRRLAQLVVEPVLLVRAHERAARVVSDVRDVIVVPAFDGEGEGVLACRALMMAIERKKRGWGWQLTQTSDAAVVVARVDNDQVHQLAQLERPPHAEVVVQIDLPDGHPLEVRPHGVHLPLVDADRRAVVAERLLGVVEVRESVTVPVVRDLCCANAVSEKRTDSSP